MAKAKQSAVSKSVQSAVNAPAADAPIVANVAAFVAPNVETTQDIGFRAANVDGAKAEIVGELVGLLKDQPYQVWDLVKAGFCAGALRPTEKRPAGYADPQKLWERYALEPLAVLGINKPVSEKSSAARVQTPEAKAKADAAKAEREALAKMTVAECRKELETCKDDVRKAKLYGAMVARDKADKKEAQKKVRDGLKDLRTSCIDIIKAMEIKAGLVEMHTALAKVVAKYSKPIK